jgi:hypothetical protein
MRCHGIATSILTHAFLDFCEDRESRRRLRLVIFDRLIFPNVMPCDERVIRYHQPLGIMHTRWLSRLRKSATG